MTTNRVFLAIAIPLWALSIIACGGGGKKQDNSSSNPSVEPVVQQPTSNKPETTQEKASRTKFSTIFRTLRTLETEIEQGTTQKSADHYVRMLITELKVLSSQLNTNPEVGVYNHLVAAVEAYKTANAVWQAKDSSVEALEYFKKTEATLLLTNGQLDAIKNGSIIIRIESPNFKWDYSDAVTKQGIEINTIDGAAFAPDSALKTIIGIAISETNKAESGTR